MEERMSEVTTQSISRQNDPFIKPSQMKRMLKQVPHQENLRQLGLLSDEDSD